MDKRNNYSAVCYYLQRLILEQDVNAEEKTRLTMLLTAIHNMRDLYTQDSQQAFEEQGTMPAMTPKQQEVMTFLQQNRAQVEQMKARANNG